MNKHRLKKSTLWSNFSQNNLIFLLIGALIFCGIIIFKAQKDRSAAPENWQYISCDVGQGDMELIRTGHRSAIAIDAGPGDAAAQACLKWAGIDSVPQVFITHDHLDHRGGLNTVCHECTVITTGYSQQKLSKRLPHATFQEAVAGQTYKSGSTLSLQVLVSPSKTEGGLGDGESAQENNSSLVLEAQLKTDHSTQTLNILLTGDIETSGVEKLLPHLGNEKIDILKVPHHGSKYSGIQLENQLRPAVGIISASKENSYGHPHQEILKALEANQTKILQTSKSGHIAVVLSEDGSNMQIITEKS